MKTTRLYTLYIILGLIFSSAVKAEGSSAPVLNNTGGTYTLVERYEDIEDGGVYLITRANDYKLYAMSTESSLPGNFAVVELQNVGFDKEKYEYEYPTSVTVSDVNLNSPSFLPYEYVFIKSGEGWRIKNKDNKYLLNSRSSSASMSLTENGNDPGTLFKLNGTSTTKGYSFLNRFENRNSAGVISLLAFYAPYFTCSKAGHYLALYKKVTNDTPDDTPTTAPFRVSSIGQATLYYGEKDVTLPAGLRASTYTLKTIGDKMYLSPSHNYNAGDKIPAGVGVVVKGNEGNYELTLTAPDKGLEKYPNVLKGTDNDELVTDANSLFYMLSLNKESDPNSIGFYWGTEDGAAFVNKAHKAYLPVPNSAGAKSVSIRFYDNEEGNATGLDHHALGTSTKDMKHDVLGRRVSNGSNTIQIIKGKKVISR